MSGSGYKNRLLIYALATAMLLPALLAYGYIYIFSGAIWPRLLYIFSRVFLLGWPILVFLVWEKGKLTRPRFNSGALFWGLGSGVLFGLFILACYYFLFVGRLNTAGVLERAEALGVRDHYLAFSVFLSLGNSALEEYYWRWFVFGRLAKLMPAGAAAFISALAFALHHFIVLSHFFGPATACLFSAAIIGAGVAWALIYRRTGSLAAPWLGHLLADAAIMTAGYDLLFGG